MSSAIGWRPNTTRTRRSSGYPTRSHAGSSAATPRFKSAQLPYSSSVVVDQDDQPVILLHSKWDLDYCSRENPDLQFHESSPIDFAIDEPALPFGLSRIGVGVGRMLANHDAGG